MWQRYTRKTYRNDTKKRNTNLQQNRMRTTWKRSKYLNIQVTRSYIHGLNVVSLLSSIQFDISIYKMSLVHAPYVHVVHIKSYSQYMHIVDFQQTSFCSAVCVFLKVINNSSTAKHSKNVYINTRQIQMIERAQDYLLCFTSIDNIFLQF